MASEPWMGPTNAIGEEALSALLEASAAMNASLDLATTLREIARLAAKVLGAEGSSVLLLDKARGKLIFEAATGDRSDVLLGEAFDADRGIAGRVASTGQAVIAGQARQHPAFFDGIDAKTNLTTRDLMAAPMRYRGEIVGVVEVLNRIQPGGFTDHDLDVLQVFANLAAISTVNAQRHDRLKLEYRGLREGSQPPQPLIGESPAWRAVLELAERVSRTDATVLLLGETGTGKELTARAIHDRSRRHEHPFIAINCAALPETLLESELFGHEEGAFTGAVGRKLGRFELAAGGTLFLDEIGDISLATQVKLLRVLQEREFVRVGGSRTIACDVRIIAATNRNLEAAMQRGMFREDLYYRLNVFPIRLPPLRERGEDILRLVEHYTRFFSRELGRPVEGVSEEARRLLGAYSWPGNVRELRNVIERAVLLCDGPLVTPAHLPPEVAGRVRSGVSQPGFSELEACERAMIVKALEEHGWNQTRAARALGLSRDNLRYRLRKYGIRRPDSEEGGEGGARVGRSGDPG